MQGPNILSCMFYKKTLKESQIGDKLLINIKVGLISQGHRTIIHEQNRSIFLGNNRAILSEYGYNINRLTLIARVIWKYEKRAKMLGFSVNICYPSKNARYSIG
jgi:hypothetical protein